jgi:hypothetical protein
MGGCHIFCQAIGPPINAIRAALRIAPAKARRGAGQPDIARAPWGAGRDEAYGVSSFPSNRRIAASIAAVRFAGAGGGGVGRKGAMSSSAAIQAAPRERGATASDPAGTRVQREGNNAIGRPYNETRRPVERRM